MIIEIEESNYRAWLNEIGRLSLNLDDFEFHLNMHSLIWEASLNAEELNRLIRLNKIKLEYDGKGFDFKKRGAFLGRAISKDHLEGTHESKQRTA